MGASLMRAIRSQLAAQLQSLEQARRVLCANRLGLPIDIWQCEASMQSIRDAQNWLSDRGASGESLELARKTLACVRHNFTPSESACAKSIAEILRHESLVHHFLESSQEHTEVSP